MELLWDQGALSVREVINALPQSLAYTTVATVMQNLQRKSLVRAEREGRSVRHRALLSREEHAAGLMRQALESSSDRAASILHFVQAMPPEEVSLLTEYLEGLATDNQQDLP